VKNFKVRDIVMGFAICLSMVLSVTCLVLGARAAKAAKLIDQAYAQIERPETITKDQLREIYDSFRWCAPLNSKTSARAQEIIEVVKYVRYLRDHGFRKGEITYYDGVFRIDNVSLESYYGPYYASAPFS
jgi:hypothetical protein